MEVENTFQMSLNADAGSKEFVLKTVLHTIHRKMGKSKDFEAVLLLWLAVFWITFAKKKSLKIGFEQGFYVTNMVLQSIFKKTHFEIM